MSVTIGRRARTVEVSSAAAEQAVRAALRRRGAPLPAAARVAAALVRNEQRELPSHGLLRLDDYLGEIAAGTLRVGAVPTVTAPSAAVRVVDGERAFGVLAGDAVADALCDVLGKHEVGAVSLVNANHLGALRDLGAAVAGRGLIVLGFVNYLGAGQRVPPWGARDGRLCTNPVLIAMPAGSGPPFVLDVSTSTVSEGSIRTRLLAGRRVPRGWLVDDAGRPVTDPAGLYAAPPRAFMTPLGGTQGHKGFGLALAVELLAGVIAGAGAVGPLPATGGNGGLFLGLRPTLAGRSPSALAAAADALRRHTTTTAGGRPNGARWPGQRPRGQDPRRLRIDVRVWEAVTRAAGDADGAGTIAATAGRDAEPTP